MTEKEKMLAGILYQASDPQLSHERLACKEKLHQFNHWEPCIDSFFDLKNLLGSVGESCGIVTPFYCDYGANIHIGHSFFANTGCVMLDCNTITIGNNVMLAPNVGLHTATHPIDAKTRNEGLELALPIVIEDNVWIGAGAIILPGVSIGKNSVVGAGSVVTKSVPSNAVVVGNPARVVKIINNEEEIL